MRSGDPIQKPCANQSLCSGLTVVVMLLRTPETDLFLFPAVKSLKKITCINCRAQFFLDHVHVLKWIKSRRPTWPVGLVCLPPDQVQRKASCERERGSPICVPQMPVLHVFEVTANVLHRVCTLVKREHVQELNILCRWQQEKKNISNHYDQGLKTSRRSQ